MSNQDNVLIVLSDTSGKSMLMPEDINTIIYLHKEGWGTKKIAQELGISRNTVKRYLKQGGWQPYRAPCRTQSLGGLKGWLQESFLQHGGNAEVVRQELASQHGLRVSLRTVERAVIGFRKELKARSVATVRFETPPGKQLQIDFGSMAVEIGGIKRKVYLFVATLGYSRRIYATALTHERQSAWFRGLEGAFHHFSRIPDQVLIDNPRALVTKHNPVTREVVFHERFSAFAHYWCFQPKACAPYRARTKGKDERAVGYVKRNAIAGRSFASWAHLEEHLSTWMREVSDIRVHGTCKERPIDRYSIERGALRPLEGRPPFSQIRELRRIVQSDSCVEVDGNFYSVPWQHIGEALTVQVTDGSVIVLQRDLEIARHPEINGYRERSVERGHLAGVIKSHQKIEELPITGFDRPLTVYQELVGGMW